MAGAAVSGSGSSYAADALSKQFHRFLPADSRFVALSRVKKSPDAQLTQGTAVFSFPPSPQIYLVNDIVLEMNVRLVERSAQKTPLDGAAVGVVNNTMHSMIKNVRLLVNGFPSKSATSSLLATRCNTAFPVSNYGDNYMYRAYLEDLLDYDEEAKKTTLFSAGWDSDRAGYFDSPLNGGYINRRARFVHHDKSATGTAIPVQFRDDPITYTGRLKTNLQQCQQGLVPETGWKLEIFFNTEDFYIWKPATEVLYYMLKFESCYVYVGMAQLNMEILRILNSEMNKEAALYHYREIR